ncbi:hypothetical protein DFJ58DRAFT_726481 [Suillus subalutaceus]|uniref:uncharacterized protein n=1 Tax=Suillus subalutaceus TaxID=48586 RepID=UPI001B863742|nr:uncharacterized protein DFJ58DRAFT_726481 [Suillus subalutaceus]KAG1859023.1 hypothetical protein DFJ58DRAFT_726481 [Suillus subalutaceus]
MSYIFSEDDFNTNGNFINGGGPEYLAGLLNENEGLSHTLQLWHGIDWEDPSLYSMPLTSDELAFLNDGPALPQPPTPVISHFSPDARELTPSSRASSPGGEESLPEPLRDANSSTWAARNPTRPMIHRQTPPPRLSDAQKASRKIKKDQRTEITKHLHDAVAKHLQEQKNGVELLSLAHNVTPKQINDIISHQTKYCTARKVHLNNALIHAKAKEMNSGQPNGLRYTLVELREMVAQDPQMQDLTKGEKATYIAALSQHREQKVSSVRANNMATARDVLVMTERVVKELDDLRICTGTYGTLFVVQGHINDTIQSTMHGTDNSEDFWEDVYDSPMTDFLRQYEQWACTQNQNLNERDSLETVRKQALKLIVRGLVAMTGKRDIMMNYNNYETAIIETPSNIRTVGEIRKLRDALKDRTCYWAALTPAEVKVHSAELDARYSAGQVVWQPRKKRSDAGITRKRKAPPTTGQAHKENRRPSKKVKKNASAQHREAPKSAEFIESSDEEEDEGE